MLADETGLSRSTIGRMIVNKDHRGGNYRTTEEAVIKICFALELGEMESKELYNAAFRNAESGGNVLPTEIRLRKQIPS